MWYCQSSSNVKVQRERGNTGIVSIQRIGDEPVQMGIPISPEFVPPAWARQLLPVSVRCVNTARCKVAFAKFKRDITRLSVAAQIYEDEALMPSFCFVGWEKPQTEDVTA